MDLVKLYKRIRKQDPPLSCAAVVVAAGSAQRMGFDKLELMLDGQPVLVRAINAFEQSPLISEIVVVVREEKLAATAELAKTYGLSKVSGIVCGGKTRTESAYAGVMAVKTDPRLIAVHDGARPFVSKELIERCVMKASVQYAAVPVLKCTDTLRAVGPDGSLIGTYDRDGVVRVQTPQVFLTEILKGALTDAVQKGMVFTDDAAAVERMGLKLQSVEGEEENLKLTTPEDLILAEGILERRKEAVT
ncbi:MAG: 2-C-methyl-D-erythritol 4-phosphate cytidylyltransferase [Oscillospiraceae bacterium]|nr:2-C-methyl-D-erythritol 4-phosphate cytidylyltransferase [Oscillospiraceae bacterium]